MVITASPVTWWANFNPCRYLYVDTYCISLLCIRVAIVGTISTCMGISSWSSVTKVTVAESRCMTLLHLSANADRCTVSRSFLGKCSSLANSWVIKELCRWEPSSSITLATADILPEVTVAVSVFNRTPEFNGRDEEWKTAASDCSDVISGSCCCCTDLAVALQNACVMASHTVLASSTGPAIGNTVRLQAVKTQFFSFTACILDALSAYFSYSLGLWLRYVGYDVMYTMRRR